jgi:hypothetical protein
MYFQKSSAQVLNICLNIYLDMVAFMELIGAVAILAGLYYIGIIISRCIILSARRMEVEIAQKEVEVKKEQLRLLEGDVHDLELIGGVEVGMEERMVEFKEEGNPHKKETLEVVIGEKVAPKNRW